MRKVDLSVLKRYESGRYIGKIDWSNNIGVNVPFAYKDIIGHVTIIDYVKAIPQGTLTLKYNNNVLQMKTNSFSRCNLGNLVKYYNYDYLYTIGDIIDTKGNHKVEIKQQIKLWHTKCYERGYIVKCLNCGYEYNVREYLIASCQLCSDIVSFGEKYIINLFQQLNEDFDVQKIFDWSGWKRYDLYIPKHNTIIEVHGEQHYKPSAFSINYIKEYNYNNIDKNKNLLEIQNNDKLKKELAVKNKILNYIVIDASSSNGQHIKQSVLNSQINNIFDISNIDWDMCCEYAYSSTMKYACELWNSKIDIDNISAELNLSNVTIKEYLSKGNDIGLCIYNNKTNCIDVITNK